MSILDQIDVALGDNWQIELDTILDRTFGPVLGNPDEWPRGTSFNRPQAGYFAWPPIGMQADSVHFQVDPVNCQFCYDYDVDDARSCVVFRKIDLPFIAHAEEYQNGDYLSGLHGKPSGGGITKSWRLGRELGDLIEWQD